MDFEAEWLESDGAGGFASGTVGGARTRRYHALLLPATQPPVGRMVLVNGLETWAVAGLERIPLSTQRYQGEVLAPRGQDHLTHFSADPWPQWTFTLPGGAQITQSLFIHRATRLTALCWHLNNGNGDVQLEVRPMFSGRDYHATHHENAAFQFTPAEQETRSVLWRPYPGVPGTRVWSNGLYRHDPTWYRRFLYLLERERGLDDLEDLAVPGVFTFALRKDQDACMLLGAADLPASPPPFPPGADAARLLPVLRAEEADRRRRFEPRFGRAADLYLARGASRLTILAGYPWFTDWGRDTFISIRGLCLAGGRFDQAREILLAWSNEVSDGMLPNRFPDSGSAPEYNSVDASLWFIIAVHDYLAAAPRPRDPSGHARWAADEGKLIAACEAILTGYADGTRHGIRLDATDGLLFAGEPGVALTWMDAIVDGVAVTPRIGKPVEVEALWLNALWLMKHRSDRWMRLFGVGWAKFYVRFWNPIRGCLYDVIDCDGERDKTDDRLRPNQLLAIGGLPVILVTREQGQSIVAAAEAELLTPLGLRSLGPREPGYIGRYEGGPRARDGAYHQGTVWPWLLGPFVEAWVRVHGDAKKLKAEARERFVAPLWAATGGTQIPEIADGDAPHVARGCPLQAWSLGELMRLELSVLR